jgi:hypothetical protein
VGCRSFVSCRSAIGANAPYLFSTVDFIAFLQIID